MPNYDYRCQDCKNEFTVERSMKDDTKQPCLGCGGENANRIWGVVMVATGGSTVDYGQGAWGGSTTSTSTTTTTSSACGSCISKACGTCH